MQDEEVGQNIDHIDRLELAGDTDRQAFVSGLVEHVEHPIPASVPGAAECTIHRPCDLTFPSSREGQSFHCWVELTRKPARRLADDFQPTIEGE